METAEPPQGTRGQNRIHRTLGRALDRALGTAARRTRGRSGRDEGDRKTDSPGSWAAFFEALIARQARQCRKGACHWNRDGACRPEVHMSVIHPLIRDMARETVNRKLQGGPDGPGKTQSIEYVFPDGSSLVRHSDTSALDPLRLGYGYMGEPYPDRAVIGIFGNEWYGKTESREAGRTGDRP